MFNFEKLDVYQRAAEFLALTATILESLPRGNAVIADQLKRAALSIVLNIAEAQGRSSSVDAARCYSIARGSAMECAAIVSAAKILKIVNEEQMSKANELLLRIVQMLSKMSR